FHLIIYFFFSSRRRHTRSDRDWSSDVCSSDLQGAKALHILFQRPAHGVDRRRLPGPNLKRFCALVKQHSQAIGDATTSRFGGLRSEERRVGKECRSRWSRYRLIKNSTRQYNDY